MCEKWSCGQSRRERGRRELADRTGKKEKSEKRRWRKGEGEERVRAKSLTLESRSFPFQQLGKRISPLIPLGQL
jgi:hypothetical protein